MEASSLPNGNPQPGPTFNYKLAWVERLITHAAELMAAGAPVVLDGDFNVVPTAAGYIPNAILDDDALIQPESRQTFARYAGQYRSRRAAIDRSERQKLSAVQEIGGFWSFFMDPTKPGF